MTLKKLQSKLEEFTALEISATMNELVEQYRASPAAVEVVEISGGYQMRTKLEYREWVKRFVKEKEPGLTRAMLETLAIVAYRQPVTKGQIERIRGVDSDYTVRTLLHRRLIVELGRSDAPGRPYLYGTGFEFLERFGLTSLEELPPLDADVAARMAEPDVPEAEPAHHVGGDPPRS